MWRNRRWSDSTVTVSAGCVLLTLAQWSIPEPFGGMVTSLLFVCAILLAGISGGWKAGVAATILNVLAAAFLFSPSYVARAAVNPVNWLRLLLYAVLGGMLTFVSELLQRAWRRIEERQQRLEAEVQERRRSQLAEQARADELMQSESRFRALMEQAPFSIQTFAPDGRVLRVNRAWEQMWHTTLEQRGAYNMLQDRRLAQAGVLDLIRRGFQGETVYVPAIEYDVGTAAVGDAYPRRGRRWVTSVVYPLRDAHGGIQEIVVVQDDITARRRAETELVQSTEASEHQRRIFESALSNSADFIYIIDPDGRFVFMNRPMLEFLGRRETEVVGRTVDELEPLLDWSDNLQQQMRQAIATRLPVRVESPSVSASGVRQFEHILVPVLTERGRVEAVVGATRDVTERRNAEQAVRDSEQRYRAIGESIDYGVWVCDAAGRNTYASESFLKLVGLSQEECSLFGWGSVLHPDEAEETIAAWKHCVGHGERWDREHRFRGVDGQWHSVLARGVPVRNDRGQVTSWVGINLDISRLKQVESELRETDQRKDEFLATLAHELRNPLAPISNALQILKIPAIDPDLARHATEMMQRQLHHLVRLVDDLLDVSRVMRGRIMLRREFTDVASVVARGVETAHSQIDAQRHRLDILLPDHPLPLYADPVRLAQVIGNLLTNAARYTAAGGVIQIRASAEDRMAVIRVRDNGIGIDPRQLNSIFDLFFQADYNSTQSQGGLGIGLTLVRNLVEMHEGSVAASSEGAGRGSEFVVRLPLADPPEERVPVCTRTDQIPGHHSSGLQLLIVDDNRDAARSLEMLLLLQGHEVRVAHSGPEALHIVESWLPDLIFLDIGMPDMDGYEVSRRLRKMPSLRKTVITALTGWSQAEDRQQTAAAGFDHHLVKPLEPDELGRLLDGLQHARASR